MHRSLRIVLTAVAAIGMLRPAGSSDHLSTFTPGSLLDSAARARLDTGAVILDLLPARGRDLAVFGMVRTQADGDRLVAWMRQVEDFHGGRYVPAIVRFSDPPRLEDLDALVLGPGDLEDLRRCELGDCGLKLSAEEILRVRQVIATTGQEWRPAVQTAFRQFMLARVQAYLAAGHAEAPAVRDRDRPESPQAEFATVVGNFGFSALQGPHLTRYLLHYPRTHPDETESFLYWSKEELGAGKPIVSITHVAIMRGGDRSRPEVVAASAQVFATHYVTASLSLTAIVGNPDTSERYLLYVRRARADLLDGAFGGFRRRIVEERIRSEAPALLERMRRRLESGEPPLHSQS